MSKRDQAVDVNTREIINNKQSELDFIKGREKNPKHMNVIDHKGQGVNKKQSEIILEEGVKNSGMPMDETVQCGDNYGEAGYIDNGGDTINMEAGMNINDSKKAYINVNRSLVDAKVDINNCGEAFVQEDLAIKDLIDVDVISDKDDKEFREVRRTVYEFKRTNRNNDVNELNLKMKNRLLVMA